MAGTTPIFSNTENNSLSQSQEAKDIEAGTKVLQHEADGLSQLALGLDTKFARTVDVIDKMKSTRRGRLIVTGMGKSGHIARKIAATMASTGTPSYFVHPGEASHGDLGMVTEDDVVIGLSNSGEAPELSDIIAYTRRFNIPLIAITSKEHSTLGSAADITLVLPAVGEADPNGLAPTTSTTMTMALGDAISVALLERMNMTPTQFQVWHPGGKLGKKLMKVSELAVTGHELPIVGPDAKMSAAVLAMTEKNVGSVLVVEGKTLKGMITDGDLKRHMSDDLMEKPVSDIMSTNPKSIHQGALAVQALEIMLNAYEQPISSLIVYKEETGEDLVGMIRLADCLRAGIA